MDQACLHLQEVSAVMNDPSVRQGSGPSLRACRCLAKCKGVSEGRVWGQCHPACFWIG